MPLDASSLSVLRVARVRFLDRLPGEDTYTPVRETRSGKHSTLAATETLRPALGAWLREHGIRRLVDAGCGDFNWMQAVDFGTLELYAGYDLVPELIARNQRLYGQRRGHLFSVGDITSTPLVACDAILCRDVLNDLPPADALRALENFRASGARWLLATTGTVGGVLAPVARLTDGVGAALGIWLLNERP